MCNFLSLLSRLVNRFSKTSSVLSFKLFSFVDKAKMIHLFDFYRCQSLHAEYLYLCLCLFVSPHGQTRLLIFSSTDETRRGRFNIFRTVEHRRSIKNFLLGKSIQEARFFLTWCFLEHVSPGHFFSPRGPFCRVIPS